MFSGYSPRSGWPGVGYSRHHAQRTRPWVAACAFPAPKGACPPTTPYGVWVLLSSYHPITLQYYTVAVGGAAPVNPCPRNARGGAVFFIVLFWLFFVVYGLFFFSFVVVWLSSPFSGVFCVFRLVVVCCRSGCLFASPLGGSVSSSPCGGHRFSIRR